MNITAVCNLHSPRCLPLWWWSYCCRGSPFLEHDMIRWYTCNKGQLQIFSEALKKITCLAQCAYKCKQMSFAFRYHKLNLKTEPFNSTQRWKTEKVQKHNKIKKKHKTMELLRNLKMQSVSVPHYLKDVLMNESWGWKEAQTFWSLPPQQPLLQSEGSGTCQWRYQSRTAHNDPYRAGGCSPPADIQDVTHTVTCRAACFEDNTGFYCERNNCGSKRWATLPSQITAFVSCKIWDWDNNKGALHL